MGRLVIVSNRAPSVDGTADSGGLVVALRDALSKNGGLWIGGAPEQQESPSASLILHDRPDFSVGLFECEPELYREFYLGYCNSVLWPAFHGRVDLIDVQKRYAEAYATVNKRLARMVAENLQEGDQIWVHDYQLIPLAQELKALGVRNRIGFFLHIPLPDLHTFMAIPDWQNVARWFSAYDLVGFQTSRDLGHMISIFQHGLRGELRANGNIGIDGREVALGAYPISIDVEGFREFAVKGAEGTAPAPMPRLIGVDRLDYSKGLPQRLAGYGEFLEKYPAYRSKVSLLQIAPPTRNSVDAYKAIRAELEHLAGRINGRFGTVDWTPVQYLHRALPREELAVLFRYSRVGLVTPLFDGMNLVAKEYVAAQNEADPGVLILSQFAGAAEEMSEALIVNPHDASDIAETIQRALDMPLSERIERHEALYSKLKKHDVTYWTSTFLSRLSPSPLPVLPYHRAI